MGRADRFAGLQRMVTNGDVIYVYKAPSPVTAQVQVAEPQVAPVAESEAEAPAAAETEAAWFWDESYTPAPPGYAFEFGTGRLVPIRPDLIPPE